MNGEEAVELFRDSMNQEGSFNQFKIIFMDINMPIMDGYEATRQIKQMQEEHAKRFHLE